MRGSITTRLARSLTCALIIVPIASATAGDDRGIAGRLRRIFRGDRTRAEDSVQVSAPQSHQPNPSSDYSSSDQVRAASDWMVTPTARASELPDRRVFDSATDQELARFEEMAIATHPTLKQAQSAIRAAEGRQIQAGLYPNPTVGYSGSELGNDGRAGQQGIVIGQEIVRGCKLQWSSLVAEAERDRAELQAELQYWQVRNAVRSLYFELLASQDMVRLTNELVALAEKGVTVAQQREKAGEGTLTEILQAQIELDEVRILASNSLNRQRATWGRFAVAIGAPRSTLEPLRGSLESPDIQRDADATLAHIQAESPETKLASVGVRRAEAAVARARAELVPNVTVEAGTQYDFATNSPIANLGLSWPLRVHNRNQGNIIATESEQHVARLELDRVSLSIAGRFADVYARYRTALDQVERYGRRLPDAEIQSILSLSGSARQQSLDAHAQILPRAQLALALATEGWQRGEFNYLQVLTAQRTLTQATLSYIRALASLRQAVIAMDGYLLSEPGRTLGDKVLQTSDSDE